MYTEDIKQELPKEALDIIRKQIQQNPRYIELSRKRNEFIKRGNYMMAMKTFEATSKVEDLCKQEYMKVYANEVRLMSDLVKTMSEDDQMLMNIYGNLLCMLVDITEISILNTNQLLHKYHPSYRMDMFDKIAELGEAAKNHVKIYDSVVRDDYHQNLYGDTADKMYELCFNKSKSFINKLQKHSERINKKNRKYNETD